MAFDSYGAPTFGLNDVKIAVWNSTDSYGTAVDVPSVQLMGAVLRILSAQLEGDDKITATASRAIGGQSQLRFGSVSIAALEVMLGNSSTASGTTPTQQDELRVSGGDNMPYFGICGKALAEEGSGDLHVFLPKVKITSDVTLASLQYGQFAIPELTVEAVDDATYGIINLVEHETAVAIQIPPTNLS
ncbi:MAG TPA: hypothetical protein VKA67_10085 [Verrucomicrobiae bacterium]|nr:hypothetical protein [Verrucomicrobiae bacterium]